MGGRETDRPTDRQTDGQRGRLQLIKESFAAIRWVGEREMSESSSGEIRGRASWGCRLRKWTGEGEGRK